MFELLNCQHVGRLNSAAGFSITSDIQPRGAGRVVRAQERMPGRRDELQIVRQAFSGRLRPSRFLFKHNKGRGSQSLAAQLGSGEQTVGVRSDWGPMAMAVSGTNSRLGRARRCDTGLSRCLFEEAASVSAHVGRAAEGLTSDKLGGPCKWRELRVLLRVLILMDMI